MPRPEDQLVSHVREIGTHRLDRRVNPYTLGAARWRQGTSTDGIDTVGPDPPFASDLRPLMGAVSLRKRPCLRGRVSSESSDPFDDAAMTGTMRWDRTGSVWDR